MKHSTFSPAIYYNLMTDHERYLFDLQGFLAVPNVLSLDEIDRLNTVMDRRLAEECPADMRTHRFGNLLRWNKIYRQLIDHPKITPYLAELLGERFRLDHDYADVIRAGEGPIETTLHGGATPFDPSMYFSFHDHRMHNGLTVVAFNLKDVHPGDGGFACVPGSHKSHYPFPSEWKALEMLHACVRPVTGPAGSVVIFTEALTHGTLPWRGKGERRTVFYKYSPHSVSWSARYYTASGFPDLTERQREILEAPNARYQSRKSADNGGKTRGSRRSKRK